jgi:hypothetical protein
VSEFEYAAEKYKTTDLVSFSFQTGCRDVGETQGPFGSALGIGQDNGVARQETLDSSLKHGHSGQGERSRTSSTKRVSARRLYVARKVLELLGLGCAVDEGVQVVFVASKLLLQDVGQQPSPNHWRASSGGGGAGRQRHIIPGLSQQTYSMSFQRLTRPCPP